MKINNNNVKSPQTTSVRANDLEKDLKTKAKNPSTSSAVDISSSAKVKMSPEAQAIQKAKAIASADTVDEAKVARLQKLIDEGKYKVDAEAVADRLVNEHLLSGE